MLDLDLVFAEIGRRLPLPGDEPLRLFHGRGRTFPGGDDLTIDWYPPIAVVTLHEPRDAAWMERLRSGLSSLPGAPAAGIVVQGRGRHTAAATILHGSVPESLDIREDGLAYRVEPLARQNIGFFPDMRPGRRLVRDIAAGKSVLNLFAYTCAFSVAAIAGGARQVTNVDMNGNLLERGRENHRRNGHDLRTVSFLPYNLFKSFGRLKKIGPFDLAIVDPPYRQGDSFRAERDWPKIVRQLPQLLAPGGEIVAAVSAPELGRRFLLDQFAEHLPAAELVAELTAGENFPEADPDKGLHVQHYRLPAA